MRIGIIGGGFSTTSLLWHIARKGFCEHSFFVFDKDGNFGSGFPYSKWHDSFFMNVPTPRLSISPTEPGHFVEWLKRNGHSVDDFVRRSSFGSYLKDCFSDSAGIIGRLETIEGNVSSVADSGGAFVVHTTSGQNFVIDALVIASGPAQLSHPEAERQCQGLANYFADPWKFALRNQRVEKLLILGSGLTACDVAFNALKGGAKNVTMLSRHGMIPKSHVLTDKTPAINFDLNEFMKRERFSSKARFFREHCRQAGTSWQTSFDQIRPHVPKIWQALDPADKRRFLRHLKSYWNIHRHRIPGPTDSCIQDALKNGRLNIFKGSLENLKERITRESPDAVVNALGVSYDPEVNPLLRTMLNTGLITKIANGMGFTPAHPRIYSIGCSKIGTEFESTATRELSIQAKALADELGSNHFPAGGP